MSQILQLASPLKKLAGTLVPLAIPFIWNQGRKIYYAQKSPKYKARIKPLSLRNFKSIVILLVTAVSILAIYFPLIKSNSVNVFELTNARMQTPGEIIGSRMRSFYAFDTPNPESEENKGKEPDELWSIEAQNRMPRGLRKIARYTTQDQWDRFFARLSTLDGRALYTCFGTDPYLNCDFCRTDQPWTFFVYMIPTIAAPYIINLLMVLIVTRGPRALLTTPQAAQWGNLFTTLTISAGIAESYSYYSYHGSRLFMVNRTMPNISGVSWVSESSFAFRVGSLAIIDLSLAVLIWLSATGRAWDNSFTDDGYYRVTQKAVQALDLAVNKLRIATLLHSNVIATNKEFRSAYEAWGENIQEFEHMLRANEQVKEAINSAQKRKGALLRNVEVEAQALIERM